MNLISHEGKGGADRLALDISKGLKKRGHRAIFGAPSYCALLKEAEEAGVEVFDPYPQGTIDMSGLDRLLTYCGKEPVDIVVAHHTHGRHMLVRARLKGLKAKIVFTRHCILSTLPYLGSFPYNFVVDMNIAVSNAVAASLVRGGIFPGKVATVYGGVDIKKFEDVRPGKVEECRARYSRKGSSTIGIVARLQHARKFGPEKPTLKGHDVLFSAAARLGDSVNILVIGPWEENDIEKLKLIARHHGLAPDRITFCGFQDDITPFYKIMDLNVLPSPREGLGLSLIEGMAAGVPCIGAGSGGIKEIITDGVDGSLFRPGDSSDLAEKIRGILENKEMRERFIARGKEKAKTLFAIEKTVRETEKVFYDLLN